MEYKETFIVKGKYGIHVGPNCKIAMLVLDKRMEFFDENKNLEVTITRNYCSNPLSKIESADASHAGELLSLGMTEGSELEVIAKLDPKDSNQKYKKELKELVRGIGNIIRNIDKFTIRQH